MSEESIDCMTDLDNEQLKKKKKNIKETNVMSVTRCLILNNQDISFFSFFLITNAYINHYIELSFYNKA